MGTPTLALMHSFETPNYPTAELASNGGNIVNTLSHPFTSEGQDYYLEMPHATKVKTAYSRFAGAVGTSLDGVASVIFSGHVRFENLTIDAAGGTIPLLKIQKAASDVCGLDLVRVDDSNHQTELVDVSETTRDTHSNTFTESTWHWLEICVVRGAGTGVVWIHVDGSLVLNFAAGQFGTTAGDLRLKWSGQSGAIVGAATVPCWANCGLFGDGGGDALTYADFQSATGKKTLCIVDKPVVVAATPDYETDGTTDTPVDLDDGSPSAGWGRCGDNDTATYAIYYNGHGGAVRGTEPWHKYCDELDILKSFRSNILGAGWFWDFRALGDTDPAYAAAADQYIVFGCAELTGNATVTCESAGLAVQFGTVGRIRPWGHANCPDVDARYAVIGFKNNSAINGTLIVRCRDHWTVYAVNHPMARRREIGPPNWTSRDPDSDREVK